ncbi:cytochrome c oxidase subunit II [Silvanigrella aquatica]|uniref:Cytochrome c oxidase subunit 2 n=1 Tax=Silvanigrella aquatica TaxID=1915309 RepID=A0A1L4D4T3_9BACT|nr:cytochrome c oxidase subunit II [Silvanigrella aquatica]
MPQNASPLTGGQDALFYFIYYLSVFFFIVVVGFMVYFAWKYRKKKEGEKTPDIHGNTKLEIIWSVIPGILFIVIFIWGFRDWVSLNQPPQDAMEVRVTGRKWDWSFLDVKTGAETSDLFVPVNKAVLLTMSSADVIHGFYVPDFRINRDVLPTMYTKLWFKAEKEGNYPILCTQYCGTKHSQMVRYVRVVSEEEYQKQMIAAQGAGLTPAQLGKKIFEGKGACASCHSVTKERTRLVGPPLYGAYGTDHKILIPPSNKEETIKFDDNYIRKSILEPNYRGVPGYALIMPSYQGQLNDKELSALAEYIKSLKE